MDIISKPEEIYIVVEKRCRLSLHHQQKVLAKKGFRRVHMVANEHGENVTAVACENAIGSGVPSMTLFKVKRMKPEWTDYLPPGAVALMTNKGSMNIETSTKWLKHFAKYKSLGRCLIIFDGTKCHLDYSIVTTAEQLKKA